MGCFCTANRAVIDAKWAEKDVEGENELDKCLNENQIEPIFTTHPNRKDNCLNKEENKLERLNEEIVKNHENTNLNNLIDYKKVYSGYIIDETSFKKTTYNTGTLSHLRRKNNKEFGDKLLHEINTIRINPAAYCLKIEKMMKCIKINEESNKSTMPYVFEYRGLNRIGLRTGEIAFQNIMEYLRTLSPAPALKWNDDLKIDISECDDFTSNSFQVLIEKKKEDLGNDYPYFSVNLDVIPDAEVSALLQLIDDTPFQGHRRDAILNTKFTSLAVSQGKDRKKKLFTLLSFA